MDTTPLTELANRPMSRRRAFQAMAAGGVAVGATGVGLAAFPGAASADITFPVNVKEPEPADLPVLGFLNSLEQAAKATYAAAIAKGIFSGEQLDVIAAFGEHHSRHASAYSGLAGKYAPTGPNPKFTQELDGKVTRANNTAELLQVLWDLEETLISTASLSLVNVVGTDGADRIASVLSADSRHSVVLGQFAKASASTFLPPFETVAAGLSVADYPVE